MKQTKEDILISEAYNKVYEDTHSHQHINNRQNNINDEERSATAFGTKEVTTNKMDAHSVSYTHLTLPTNREV